MGAALGPLGPPAGDPCRAGWLFAVGSVVAALSTGISGRDRRAGPAGQPAPSPRGHGPGRGRHPRDSSAPSPWPIIGISVGLAFMLALIVAPAVAWGLRAVRGLLADRRPGGAGRGRCCSWPGRRRRGGRSHGASIRPGSVRAVLRDRDLLRLDASVLLPCISILTAHVRGRCRW
ncbi:MAG: hypothetical protein U5L11_00555 [Arhodomonas sp.]|nr:hypothetical protein [Arhodomonas sp.]